jgi:hypothetical protein
MIFNFNAVSVLKIKSVCGECFIKVDVYSPQEMVDLRPKEMVLYMHTGGGAYRG